MSAGAFLHQTTSKPKHRVRVWDLPTRLFHGLLVVLVVCLFITAYIGALDWHMRIGCAMLALLLFRLVWGVVGGHWSRFARFLPSPRRIWARLGAKADVEPETLGHKPLGALSVWAMLLVLFAQVLSGLLSDDDIAYAGPWAHRVPEAVSHWMTDYHAAIGQWLLVVLVLLHLGAVFFYLLAKKENLIGPMWHGDKMPRLTTVPSPASRDDLRTRLLALGLLLACVASSWYLTGFAA
ncbi:cytochrome B561 [Hylemonella gracilis str. Niagara R]|uniref:Cytochrome B561 n=1 Tax=Hylemonella gracilis str. Niagara R TaxID=1458275 RepID=A0A016XC82_9BURK|nr:cytochrome b/b6 domain-containing protein [Hylemonella gracilis]EYC49709.1 cytochrome B561 [Hylemonella gracilis str. Niagara R]